MKQAARESRKEGRKGAEENSLTHRQESVTPNRQTHNWPPARGAQMKSNAARLPGSHARITRGIREEKSPRWNEMTAGPLPALDCHCL